MVAVWSNYSMEDMWDLAYSVQNRWKSGEISRYQVVASFVDDLLYGAILDPKDLERLNILTTVKDGWFGVQTCIRTPTDAESLRTMLIQTAWIPFAVGDDLWHNNEHMDGAFSMAHHPICEHNLGLALLDWDLMANVLNVNLGRNKVEQFWNQGLARGL